MRLELAPHPIVMCRIDDRIDFSSQVYWCTFAGNM